MTVQDQHNRGQTDASEGRNEPPHTLADRATDIVTFHVFTEHPGRGLSKEERDEERGAYQAGQDSYHSQTDSCCYITSACLDDLGLPRTSREMTAMKTLTRNHVLKSFRGKRDYITYGRIAPKVVQAIRSRADCRRVWENVYGTLGEVANLVGLGKYEEGHQQYKSLVLGLEAQFLK